MTTISQNRLLKLKELLELNAYSLMQCVLFRKTCALTLTSGAPTATPRRPPCGGGTIMALMSAMLADSTRNCTRCPILHFISERYRTTILTDLK